MKKIYISDRDICWQSIMETNFVELQFIMLIVSSIVSDFMFIVSHFSKEIKSTNDLYASVKIYLSTMFTYIFEISALNEKFTNDVWSDINDLKLGCIF